MNWTPLHPYYIGEANVVQGGSYKASDQIPEVNTMKNIRNLCISMCLILSTVLVISGCTTGAQVANPRTMTFSPLKFEIPKTERVQLKNGMIVHMLEDHELPIVSITAYIKTGSIYEPADKAGLAGLTGAVMRSGGTMSRTPEKLDAELEFMASSIESSIGADVGNISLSCLKKNLDATLFLFADLAMNPAFREDRVALAKNRTIEGCAARMTTPRKWRTGNCKRPSIPITHWGEFPPSKR
ncbi:M16 family metallopeptidase [Geotalea toluenoxydans]|uniref:M16 family metallopeptidase n=1 Tax=Geotalea toluenoxydans TaxID=421624 RepID=UPI000B096FBC